MKRVLMVEDEAPIARFASRLLRMRGYDVITAANDVTAMEMARQQCPDLVLMDLVLEGSVNGLEVTRMMRGTPELKHVPIIMVTATSSGEILDEAFAAGANDVEMKPIDFDRLVPKMEALLNG